MKRIARRVFHPIVLTCVASALAASATAQTAPGRRNAAPSTVLKYEFGTSDVVEFKFPYSRELDFTAPVRPDGAIFFPYLGDVSVVGLTVSELSAQLRARYASILKDPELVITVREFARPTVYVAGEVQTPGHIDYRSGMTMAQALFAAGGYRDSAATNTVLLLRAETPGMLRVTPVRLRYHSVGATADVALAPDDIVIVPKSRIARLGQIIRQYTRDLLPISNLGLFFDLVGATNASVGLTPGGAQ